jgi:hypothetical protein
MTETNKVTSEIQTYAQSPYAKGKCLAILRDAYGPRARIWQNHVDTMKLCVDDKEIVEVKGPLAGLPWALVTVGYDRLGFTVGIDERGLPYVTAKGKQNGSNADLPALSEGKADTEISEGKQGSTVPIL